MPHEQLGQLLESLFLAPKNEPLTNNLLRQSTTALTQNEAGLTTLASAAAGISEL